MLQVMHASTQQTTGPENRRLIVPRFLIACRVVTHHINWDEIPSHSPTHQPPRNTSSLTVQHQEGNTQVHTFSELDGLVACSGDCADDLCEGLKEQVLLLGVTLKIGVAGIV